MCLQCVPDPFVPLIVIDSQYFYLPLNQYFLSGILILAALMC